MARRRNTSPITKTRGRRARVEDQATLKVGDVVRLLNKPEWEADGPRRNQSGVVRTTTDGLGVEFFREIEGGHVLDGTAKKGHGWYLSTDHRVSQYIRRGRRPQDTR